MVSQIDKLKRQPFFIWTLMTALLSICVELDLWAMLICFGLFIWRLYLPLPNTKITGGIAALLFALVYFQFGSLLGREPAIHFLALLTAIKFLEFNNQRDEKFLFLLGLFLIVAKFLFSIELFVFIFQISLLYFYLYSYLRLHNRENFHRFLLQQIFLALPLAIGLFIFFPRLSYNFPPVNQTLGKVGFSGFSEEMSPGDVSQVIKSDDLVFRARLVNSFASAENLYWRGEVLEVNQGFSWKKNPISKGLSTKFPVSRSLLHDSGNSLSINMQEKVKYQIILEPHANLWLFALDRPTQVTADEARNPREFSGVYELRYPLRKRMIYNGLSSIESFLNIEKQKKWHEALQIKNTEGSSSLPSDILVHHDVLSSDVQKLVKEIEKNLIKENKKPLSKISRLFKAKKILDYFQKNGFSYSLNPPREASDLEGFLLKSKNGYCEHYSSSFAILARALQIPSRVVVGYYGGEYNSLGDFWKITQKHAHAWSEILLENGRWLRVDPTAVIGGTSVQMSQVSSSRQKTISDNSWEHYFQELQLSFDVINFRWTAFLLDYSLESQKEIFSLVVQYFQNITVVFTLLIILFFLIKHLRVLLQKRSDLLKPEGLYKEFSEITQRPPHKAPWAWHEEFSKKEPQFQEVSENVTLVYIKKSYHPQKEKPRNLVSIRHGLIALKEHYNSFSKNSKLFKRK